MIDQPGDRWDDAENDTGAEPPGPEQLAVPRQGGRHRGGRRRAASARSRRVPTLIGAVLTLALVGGTAFAALQLWPSQSVNPAERLPDSALSYLEVNLDPGRGQTANLLDLLEKFDALDAATDTDAVITELLAQLDLDGVDPDKVSSWLGTRGAAAAWLDPGNEDSTIAVALASRDDDAARDGLAAILEESDEDFGYVVDDGLAVLAFTDGDAQARAEEIVTDGRAAPLAKSASFQSDLEWLDGDQLALMWINFDEAADIAEEALTLAGASGKVNLDQVYGLYEMESGVVGVQATDAGIEVRYRFDGDYGIESDQSDWLDRLGRLRTSQIGAIMTLPDDLNELSEPLLESIDEPSSTPDTLDDYTRGQWEYDLAMTDEELAEYDDLYRQWTAGDLAEDDAEFDRFVELDHQYALFGLQSDYDEWISAGNSDEQWRYERALTHDEFNEFIELEALVDGDQLTDEEQQRFYNLDARLYSFGVVSDYPSYEPAVDVFALADEIYELASGATFTLALGELFAEPEIGLGDELVFDGSTAVFGDLEGSGETLADHPRFGEAFADMPNEASVAVFVDVRSLYSTAPESEEWLKPIRVASFVQDTTGSGVIRVLID